jgi:flavin-dependent dehydrogenase
LRNGKGGLSVIPGERETDVFVIGGGPAGLAAAIAARQKGFSVTLADGAAPPIEKPCGEGLMPETRKALADLGVALPAATGFPFRGIQFVADGRRASGDFPQGQGIGLRRPVLHSALVQHAETLGVHFLWKTPVRGIAPYEVLLAQQQSVKTRWIIGADGTGSRVRRWSDLDTSLHRQQRSATRRHYRVRPWNEYMEIHWAPHSQAYVTPISSEEVCIVTMAERPAQAAFDESLANLPELRERLAGAELSSRERGVITAMCSLRRVARGNVALVGDASGGVDAITGEGLRLSFRQALALADTMAANDLCAYQRAHRHLALRPLLIGELMLQLARNSWLRERYMRAMQRRADLFERLLAMHVSRPSPKDMVTASAQFGWQFLAA